LRLCALLRRELRGSELAQCLRLCLAGARETRGLWCLRRHECLRERDRSSLIVHQTLRAARLILDDRVVLLSAIGSNHDHVVRGALRWCLRVDVDRRSRRGPGISVLGVDHCRSRDASGFVGEGR